MNEDHERTNQLTLMWSKDISEWDGSSSHCPFIPNIEKEGLPTAKSSVSLLCFYNKNPLSFVDFPDLQVYLIFHISESKHENSQKSLQLKDSYVGSPSWQPKEHSHPTNILPLITKQEVGESLYFEKVCDWLYILKSLVTHWNIVNLTKATHFKKKKPDFPLGSYQFPKILQLGTRFGDHHPSPWWDLSGLNYEFICATALLCTERKLCFSHPPPLAPTILLPTLPQWPLSLG